MLFQRGECAYWVNAYSNANSIFSWETWQPIRLLQHSVERHSQMYDFHFRFSFVIAARNQIKGMPSILGTCQMGCRRCFPRIKWKIKVADEFENLPKISSQFSTSKLPGEYLTILFWRAYCEGLEQFRIISRKFQEIRTNLKKIGEIWWKLQNKIGQVWSTLIEFQGNSRKFG